MSQGHRVFANVPFSEPLHPKVRALEAAGVEVFAPQPVVASGRLKQRLNRLFPVRAPLFDWLQSKSPDLVVVCQGGTWPRVQLLAGVAKLGLRYVTLAQVNCDLHWLDDITRVELKPFIERAAAVFFVSHANQELAEFQIGFAFSNAIVVSNPWAIESENPPAWPDPDATIELRLASVARLHNPSKGHDLLLLALSQEVWKDRNWKLTFFGEGPHRGALELMAERLSLDSRVTFAGHVEDVRDIWRRNHALVLASRYEGMPLALLEAMICTRPAMVTGVAGNPEVVAEGVNGFIADVPSPRAVGDALERLWQNRGRLLQMGRMGRDILLAKHRMNPEHEFAAKLLALVDRR